MRVLHESTRRTSVIPVSSESDYDRGYVPSFCPETALGLYLLRQASDLERRLQTSDYPRRIVLYSNSHFSSSDDVSTKSRSIRKMALELDLRL